MLYATVTVKDPPNHTSSPRVNYSPIYVQNYTIHMYSGITSGRMLNGEFLYIKILEVNLFAFAYRLVHRDFSPINGAYCNMTRSIDCFCREIISVMHI